MLTKIIVIGCWVAFSILSFPPYILAQESLPQTVIRHEKEIKSLRQEIITLSSEIKKSKSTNKHEEGFSAVAKPDPKAIHTIRIVPSAGPPGCSVKESTIDFGKGIVPFKNIVTFNIKGSQIPYQVPYLLFINIECPPYFLNGFCNGSGSVPATGDSTFATKMKRDNRSVPLILKTFKNRISTSTKQIILK